MTMTNDLFAAPTLSKTLQIRVTDKEREQVRVVSSRAGMSSSAYMRYAFRIITRDPSTPTPVDLARKLHDLRAEVGKVGSNINQIAHAANAGVDAPKASLSAALVDLGRLRDAITETIASLRP